MFDKIIAFSIRSKVTIGAMTLLLVIWGLWSATRLPIDAVPDITNNQVQVITQAPSLGAQEVEQFITAPIELALSNIPGVLEKRSISRSGISVITVVFRDETDIYWARQQVGERLKEAEANIPKNSGEIMLAPITTGLGEIYHYVIHTKPGFEDKYSATDLRTMQDWIVKTQLAGTEGLAEVSGWGGFVKQYEVALDNDKLNALGISIPEIFEAIERNNENTGGSYIEQRNNAYFIRGLGQVKTLNDIERIVVKNDGGIPVLVRDVATVQFGKATRYGAVTRNGEGEVVAGVALMLKGENFNKVIQHVKERMVQIQRSLPEGVVIEPFIDRTELVGRAIGTVKENLLIGALIVVFVLVLFLGNLRAGLVVASAIPLSLLFALGLMRWFGVSANLMSLGAIDFGLIVDGAVIIVEAVVHRFALNKLGIGRLSQKQMDDQVYQAASGIRNSAAFGEIIILIVYLPLLALIGIEGKMFRPMAMTVAFAILGAFILSLTWIPMACALFLSKNTERKRSISDRLMDFFHKIYAPFLEFALHFKIQVVAAVVALFVFSLFVFQKMGGEFIPTLEEGDLTVEISMMQGTSLTQAVETFGKAEKILKEKFPEVRQAVTRIGAAEIPTDPMPIERGDIMVSMAPMKSWREEVCDREEMQEAMEDALSVLPGVNIELTQPMQMRFNELMTGIRQDVAVKIYGDDLDVLTAKANEVAQLITAVPGVGDPQVEKVTGLPQILVSYDRDKLAQYGLNITDVNMILRTAFAGNVAGVVFEGEKRFDMVVRLKREEREDIANIESLFVPLPNGNRLPLGQVAKIEFKNAPAQVSRENGKRRIYVGFNVKGRDVESTVEEIEGILSQKLQLPAGYFTTYGGQFQNLREANARLSVVVPVALALIFVLLFFTFGSIKQSLLIFTAIPLSAIGGVFALWLRGMPFSISAGVGFIALFGVAVLNGIVLIGYFNQLKTEGMTDVLQRIREGTKVRLRPVIMTASVASLGFLPMALSTGAGAEVQKPLATVVIGGLITATLLTLIVLPILYFLFEKGIKGGRKTALPVSVLLVVLFGFSMNLKAQNPTLTLPEALELASKNNQLLQANAFEIQSAEALQRAAGIFPKTDFGAQLGQNNSRRFDENLSVSQDIPNPALLKARRNLAAQQTGIAQSQLAISKNELAFNVRQSWFQAQYLMALETVLLREDSLLGQFVRAASLRFKTGESNLLEKTTAETRQQNLQQSIFQVRSLIEIEKMKLQQWLKTPGDFSIQKTEFSPLVFSEMLDSTLLKNNPMLQFAQQQIAVWEAEKRVAKAERLPDFRAGYFIQSIAGAQEVDGQTVNYNATPRFQGFQVGISVPIFGAKGYRARTDAAALQILAQQKHSDYLQTQLQSQLRQSAGQFVFWKNNVAYYQNTALPNAKSIVQNASRGYQSGDIGYLEYATALQTNLEIQRSYLEAISSLNQTVISIQFLINQ